MRPADRLHIHNEVLLHQTTPFPQRPVGQDTSPGFPLQFSEMESAGASAYLASSYPTDIATVKEWINTTINAASVCNAEENLALVACTIRQTIKYRRREAKGVQSPSLTLSAGTGSCRDMATLMLEALRTLGFPARF